MQALLMRLSTFAPIKKYLGRFRRQETAFSVDLYMSISP
jgi:hypothetical protein